jgi:hypothetical protein
MLLRSRSNVACSRASRGLAPVRLHAFRSVTSQTFEMSSASVGLRQRQLSSTNSSSSASPALGRSRRALTVRASTPAKYAAPTADRLVLDVGGQQVWLTWIRVPQIISKHLSVVMQQQQHRLQSTDNS